MNTIHIRKRKYEQTSSFNIILIGMAINQELKHLVELIKFSKGLKQSEVAEELGVKPTYLSDMINGRVPFSSNLRDAICEKYSDCVEGDLNIVQDGSHNQINGHGAHGNFNGCESSAILSERVKSLEALLAEKERLIKVLMEGRK